MLLSISFFGGGGFQKIRVIRFEGPGNKEYGILGSILDSFETKKLKSTGSSMLQIVIYNLVQADLVYSPHDELLALRPERRPYFFLRKPAAKNDKFHVDIYLRRPAG